MTDYAINLGSPRAGKERARFLARVSAQAAKMIRRGEYLAELARRAARDDVEGRDALEQLEKEMGR